MVFSGSGRKRGNEAEMNGEKGEERVRARKDLLDCCRSLPSRGRSGVRLMWHNGVLIVDLLVA